MITEIDKVEAFEAEYALRSLILGIGLVGVVLIGGIGFFIARSLATPVVAMTSAMTQLARQPRHHHSSPRPPRRDRCHGRGGAGV